MNLLTTVTFDATNVEPGQAFILTGSGFYKLDFPPPPRDLTFDAVGGIMVVPEPAVYALMVGGLALAFAAWSKRRRQSA